jgi:hypothetical protein
MRHIIAIVATVVAAISGAQAQPASAVPPPTPAVYGPSVSLDMAKK